MVAYKFIIGAVYKTGKLFDYNAVHLVSYKGHSRWPIEPEILDYEKRFKFLKKFNQTVPEKIFK